MPSTRPSLELNSASLVMLRQSGSIRDRRSVASWLHGVAMRVAARARVDGARRRKIEGRRIRPSAECDTEAERHDIETIIHEELSRLPERYRAAIVLCYFEGLTHERAADRLGWPVGTVRGRLARARDLLRARLTRRGVTGSAALAAVGSLPTMAGTAFPAALRAATVRTAVEVAAGRNIAAATSTQIAAWANGASASIAGCYLWRLVAGLVIMIGVLGAGMGLVLGALSGASKQSTPPPAAKPREASLREMAQLRGTWASTQMIEDRTLGGVAAPPKPFKLLWSIEEDTITTTDEDGFADIFYRCTLDPDRTPKTIDLASLNLGVKLLGIYRIEGDTLTVCYGLERPEDFRKRATQISIVLHRESRIPSRLVPAYETAPGCYWALRPKGALPSSVGTNGIEAFIKKDTQGATVVTMAYVTKVTDGQQDVEYRPVVFDNRMLRFVPRRGQGGTCGSASVRGIVLAMHEYRLDPNILPFDAVKRFGIEAVPAETRRAAEEAASVKAFTQAQNAGIELIPRPQVGKPYEFKLTATDGRTLRTADFKGKVVLIDCWAGWCSPCMAKMPELKTLYQRHKGDGFEVIGVNFDNDHATAQRLVKNLDLPWPQVLVPIDERSRALWSEGPGIDNLPRLLLIDREGILRWDGSGPMELDDRIAAALATLRQAR